MVSKIRISSCYKYLWISCFLFYSLNNSFGQESIPNCDNISPDYTILTQNTSCDANEGSIDIIFSDDNNGYFFEWTMPSGDTILTSTPNIDSLEAGLYHLSIGIINNLDCLIPGDITFDVMEGNPSNTTEYILTNNDAEIIEISLSPNFSNIVSGDYSVYAINYTGMVSNYEIGINVEDIIIECFDLSIGTPFSICEPDCYLTIGTIIIGLDSELIEPSVVITSATCSLENGAAILSPADYIYTWADGFVGNVRDNLPSGGYILEYYEMGNPTCASYFDFEIENINPLEAEVGILSSTNCGENNGSAIVTVEGGTGNYIILWSDGGEGEQRNDLAEGTYVIDIEDTVTGCSVSISLGIDTPNNEADININNLVDVFCGNEYGLIDFSITYESGFVFPADTIITDGNLTFTSDNLSEGDYCLEIRDGLGCLKGISCFQIEAFDPILAGITIVYENCSVANVYISATGGTGNYLYDWEDIVGIDNSDNREGLTSGIYTVSITDNLGCIEVVELPISIPSCNDSIVIDIMEGILSLDTCLLEWYDLEGDIIMSGVCEDDESTVSVLANNNSSCVSLLINESFSMGNNSETVCVYHCNEFNFCDTTYITINIIVDEECPNFENQVNNDIIISDCNESTSICIPIPIGDFSNYEIFDNGIVSPLFLGCTEDTVIVYNYPTLFGQGNSGPYTLNSWFVNDNLYSGDFQNASDLVDSMNLWDIEGEWVLNEEELSITGTATNNTYSSLDITHIVTGLSSIIGINYGTLAEDAFFNVNEGEHEIIIVNNQQTNCMDTFYVSVSCPSIEIIDFIDTIFVNEMDSICVLDLGYDSGISSISNVCENYLENEVFFEIDTFSGCIVYDGLEIGVDTACIEVCNTLGQCDTSTITIIVVSQSVDSSSLILNEDHDTTLINTSTTIFPLNNDSIMGTISLFDLHIQPNNGIVDLETDGTLTYLPNFDYCGIDSFTYVVCIDEICDTAKVYIHILCKTINPFTGISPNADGVNDYFVIEGIELFNNVTIQIFNRWGNVIYQLKNGKYSNTPGINGSVDPWGGEWNGKLVPDGTYYYFIQIEELGQFSGYLQIHK